MDKMKKYKSTFEKLKAYGWKTYNNGHTNKMFSSYAIAKENGYIYEGFVNSFDNTTHFHYSDFKTKRTK